MQDNSDTTIDYDSIVTGQLRAVIPAVLSKLLAQNPGATETPRPHHFYITFATRAKGVIIPSYLKNQYPEEMTIVLQYQFWNLTVREADFSVVLSFGKTPAAITIPYDAIIQFSDPAVNFMLRFDDKESKPLAAHKEDDNLRPLNGEQSNDRLVDDERKNPFVSAKQAGEEKNEEREDNVVSLAAFRAQQEK